MDNQGQGQGQGQYLAQAQGDLDVTLKPIQGGRLLLKRKKKGTRQTILR